MGQKTLLIIAPLNSIHTHRWISRISLSDTNVVLLGTENTPVAFDYDYEIVESKFFEKNIGSLFSVFMKSREITKLVKSIEPDLVHIHWLLSPVSLILSFMKGFKLLVTPWGSDILHESRQDKNIIQKIKQILAIQIVMLRADYACCDAVHLQKRMNRYLHKPSFDSEIIYFGTDLELFNPERYSNKLRDKFNISNDDIMVLSNRGLANVYDIDTFVKAAKLVVDKGNRAVKFVIAGGGPERERLMELAQELGLNEDLFFTGRLSDEDFADLTASCDIYVSTSTSDGGIAASVAEAMSCAKPIIITNFGENGDWVELDNRTGYLFEIGDELRLADLILKLAEDPVQRKTLGSNGRRVISEKNNSIIEARKADNMYKRLLGL